MAIRRIKHAPLAVRSRPGPGLLAVFIDPNLEDVTILFIVLGVNISFIPRPKRLEAFGDRVGGVDDLRIKHAGAVAEKLSSHQGNDLVVIAEAKRGAVGGDEPASAGHVVEQGLGLGGGDLVDIGVNEQGVVFRQGRRVEVFERLGIGDVDPPTGHHRCELGGTSGGGVVAAISEKEDLQGSRRLGGQSHRRGEQDRERDERFPKHHIHIP